MDKMDKKMQNQLLNALENTMGHHHQLQRKRYEKLWKDMEKPFKLNDALILLTKDELDSIRKKLNLTGMSSLKKAEMASELARLVPIEFEKILKTFDQERYDLIRNIIKNSGELRITNEFPIYSVESLRNLGIVFPVMKDGVKQLAIPVELINQFAEVDQIELKETIRQNTEWIRLVHGMIHYYGVMKDSKLLEKIEAFSEDDVDILRYRSVLTSAIDYYQEIRFYRGTNGMYIADESIADVEEIIEGHKTSPRVDYYPFTKKQLLKAGEPGFVDKSPEMIKFLRFISESYDLTVEDMDEIADELVYMINSDDHPTMIIEYLKSIFEIPSFEFLKQLTAHVMDLYNNTRQWILKGYSPAELRKKEEKHLKPMPSFPLNQPNDSSNIIDLNARSKVGRNDPCTCGSGKKYKKCCGK
ncbi:SEC-C metal-binding domain-containing protein [Mesobacillus jeotgali]|uniref:SEC-C metal-binding domain-containing protein n=1 Tax=Mesobacillus jeotgali TaxID=129985 RepID=UPI0009A75965|nr:SEC-C metal-binding domain-containing protein [Mesobacillus jeotgali]